MERIECLLSVKIIFDFDDENVSFGQYLRLES